jgi:hypothetical protein
MKTNSRSPLLYGASGCLAGFLFMVCSIAMITLLGPAVLPLSGNALANFIDYGSWMIPVGLGLVGFIWGKRRQMDQEQS